MGITLITAIFMVSNFRFYSFKTVDLRGRVPFVSILVVLLVLILISTDPPLMLFLGFLGYAASGPVMTLLHVRQRRLARRAGVRAEDDSP